MTNISTHIRRESFEKFVESLTSQNEKKPEILRMAGMNLNHFDVVPSVIHKIGSKKFCTL